MAIRNLNIETKIYGKDLFSKKRSREGVKGVVSVMKLMTNSIGKVSATEFIVIHDIHLSDNAVVMNGNKMMHFSDYEAYVQIRAGDRRVFEALDGDERLGISKRLITRPFLSSHGSNISSVILNMFDTDLPWAVPQIYVLPGEHYDFIITCDTPIKTNQFFYFAATTTLYEGTDAVIACQLFERGVVVTPRLVEEYSRLAVKYARRNTDD